MNKIKNKTKPKDSLATTMHKNYFKNHLKALTDDYSKFSDDKNLTKNFPFKIYWNNMFIGMKTLKGMEWDLPKDTYDNVLLSLTTQNINLDPMIYKWLKEEVQMPNKLIRFLNKVKDTMNKTGDPFKWISIMDDEYEPPDEAFDMFAGKWNVNDTKKYKLKPIKEVEEKKEEPDETYNPIKDKQTK